MPAAFRVDNEVLVVTLTGGMSDSENREARNACADLCRRQAISSVLVDVRGAVIQSTLLDTYLFTASLAEGFLSGTLYALLLSPSCIDPDRAHFSEEVAAQRGIRLKMFAREDGAREWLRQGRPARGPARPVRSGNVR